MEHKALLSLLSVFSSHGVPFKKPLKRKHTQQVSDLNNHASSMKKCLQLRSLEILSQVEAHCLYMLSVITWTCRVS